MVARSRTLLGIKRHYVINTPSQLKKTNIWWGKLMTKFILGSGSIKNNPPEMSETDNWGDKIRKPLPKCQKLTIGETKPENPSRNVRN